MALTKQQQFDRCKMAARLVKVWLEAQIAAGYDSKEEIEFTTGIFAEVIHDLPKITTGYISVEAAKMKGPTTKDHYFGRKVSGNLLHKCVIKGVSIERLALVIMSRCRCYEVTPAENTRLKKFDSKKMLKSKLDVAKEYNAASIVMIRKKPKTVYIINGLEYIGKEAMAKFDISYQTLSQRCASKAKKGKYTSWTIKKNQ